MMLLVLKLLLASVVCCSTGEATLPWPPMDYVQTDHHHHQQQLSDWIGPEPLLVRLNQLLDVCIVNYEDLTTDLLLGVAIANGQVKEILATPGLKNRAFIESLQRKCDFVESRIDSIFTFPSGANAIVCKLLINSNYWQTSTNGGTVLPLNHHHPKDPRGRRTPSASTLRDYLRALEEGAPSELQSDQCLSELLVNDSENEYNSSLSRQQSPEPTVTLLLSQGCSAAMSMRRKSYGYHLTHKLLFYLVLGKQRFANIEPDFVANAKGKLCEQILRESRLIEELNYPEMFRDLFMEQVFLCAYAGFAEFRNQSWLKEIVSWQNANGCFKYYHEGDDEDDADDGDRRQGLKALCSTHMSGVAAALLGLFARLQF